MWEFEYKSVYVDLFYQFSEDLAFGMEALLNQMQMQERDGGPLSSCEKELQELMRQIDIMVAHKKSEWGAEMETLETRLDVREQELSSTRAMLDQKHIEVGMLRHQLDELEKTNEGLVLQYEKQLRTFQDELAKLKRSYEKLQKKQLKEARDEVNSKVEDKAEVSRLTKKLEEFRQKSLEWEKQRLQYQQQVASLEAQRKALAEEYDVIQQQSLRKQRLENELSSQREIHHLKGQLERAMDTVHANELAMERINMTVDDLSATNQRLLQEKQRLDEDLKHCQKQVQVLTEEKNELEATLQSQNEFIQSISLQQKPLRKEISRTSDSLHVKDISRRSPEESLRERQSPGEVSLMQLELERLRIQLEASHKSENSLQTEVTHLQNSMESANLKCIQLTQELTRQHEELRKVEEQHSKCEADNRRLKEQLLLADQTHAAEVEGMKTEITQLTRELHQRDITIAAVNGSSSSVEHQLRLEKEKGERKVSECKVTQVQLETLRIENQHLVEILEQIESGTLGKSDVSLADLRNSYMASLCNLDHENQQLRKELAEVNARLEVSAQDCRDKYHNVLQQMQSKLSDIQDAEDRRLLEIQKRHEVEMKQLHAKLEATVSHYERKMQKLQNGLLRPSSDLLAGAQGKLTDASRSNSSDSVSSKSQKTQRTLDENEANFSDSASMESLPLTVNDEYVPLYPLSVSPVDAVSTRFLEEEEVRSQQLLTCLDAHIEELKIESEKTIKKYVHPLSKDK
ncbi:centrosomal protein of 63 kDa isoform X2 [Protopterus annectens]|uniref:centrosomal protein of 63 kDa isoform X2 n=1 Tax=Protopterus annectens TaxID=7888 RepID=UPI001CF9DC68|nr:centrosomal protein of 63 kDa isoform X2 [Protopterus annectens]